METGHDYITLLLHDERAARLHGDAAEDRLVRTVAREGKPSRGWWRRRRSLPAPIIPLRPQRPDAAAAPAAEQAAAAPVERRTAS